MFFVIENVARIPAVSSCIGIYSSQTKVLVAHTKVLLAAALADHLNTIGAIRFALRPN